MDHSRSRTATRRQAMRTAIGIGAVAAGVAGGSDTVAAAGGEELWEFETRGTVVSSPTVIDSFVYVGSNDGSVYALNTSSAGMRWEFETDGAVRSSPTVVDGILFVGSGDGSLYAVDVESGEQQWAFETGGDVDSSPTVVGGTVFVGSNDGSLYAVDAESGQAEWSYDTGGAITGSPVVSDGVVFVGSTDSNLYAVDTASGDEEWTFETGGEIRSSPTVANGIVYAGSEDRNVYAVDAGSGQEEWSYETVGRLSTPTVGDGGFVRETLFIGDRTGTVYALNAELGGLRWSKDIGDDIRAAPTLVSGRLFIGNSSLYSLDAKTGEENWSADIEPSWASTNWNGTSPTVWNGTLFIGGERSLYAIDGGTTQSSQGSRVMNGALGHHSEWTHAGQTIEIDTSETTQTDSETEPESTDDESESGDSEPQPVETESSGGSPSTSGGPELVGIATLSSVGLLATLVIGGGAYWWTRSSGTDDYDELATDSDAESGTDDYPDPKTDDTDQATQAADETPTESAVAADTDDAEALRADADELLADAVDERNAGNLDRAIEQYTAAIELYTTAMENADQEATAEIEETIAQAREDRAAAEAAHEAQASIRESLQLGEESLQNAIVAHANGEYTLSKIRYRQAREEFDTAIEDAEASDVDPFSEAIEVPVGSDNSLPSEQLAELLGLSSEAVEALSEGGVETVTDLTTQPTESDDETGRQRVTVVDELLEDGTIDDELAAKLMALYWWHNEETRTIGDLEAIEARYEQAVAGYEASR